MFLATFFYTLIFLVVQPLFPGESGVDQLVEIIKVICAEPLYCTPGCMWQYIVSAFYIPSKLDFPINDKMPNL